jgi:exodeoxyribonuclease VIII
MKENQMYHADTSRVSKSGLDLIAKCPAKYFERYLNPNREPEKRTEALINGNAFHVLTLEPEVFPHHFIVRPTFSGVGSVAKREAFELEHADKEIISLETYNMVSRMRDAVRAHPIASELLRVGLAEQEARWTDEMTGAPCKLRNDWFNTSTRLIVDLKSTEDASEEAFVRSAFKYRYHVQSAFYFDGATANGMDPQGFVFIAVEKTPPFLVNVFYADEEFMAAGRIAYHSDLERYVECISTNEWPGYDPKIKPLTLPAWVIRQSN